jgi:ribonuclease P protein component
MREAVRHNLKALQSPVDVVLHPRRSVIDLEFAALEREVGGVFRAIQGAAKRQQKSSRPV